ncbi:SGNH/GDSL hydrolase family protein [Plantactinospora sp. CA-294935]|uniref:SGNH/GDSL hydrolase family protein n=1 Tax=Plantactinospora sp. CA-294935 TaxID=3240012 RepID=UPI003D8D0A49
MFASKKESPSRVGRRAFLSGVGVAAVGAQLATSRPAAAVVTPPTHRPVTIWGTSPDALPYPIADQTVRVTVRATIGARRLRVRLSNAFGTAPLPVGSAYLGRRSAGAALVPGTNKALTFGGSTAITVPPGAEVISDPVPLLIGPGDDLAISVYTPGRFEQVTGHLRPKDFSFLSPPGDAGADESGAAFHTPVEHWFWVDAVIGEGEPSAGTIVALGDSITDSGSLPRGGYQGWCDFLAERIAATLPPPRRPAILNAGISGNRLITERPGAGVTAQARLDRDVLSHAGVRTVIVLEGINDIYGSTVTSADLIAAHRQIAYRAAARGLRVIAGTVLPSHRGAYTEQRERVRTELNAYLRSGADHDGVIDFDAALRDPEDPTSLLPEYDSGDHTHPSPAGYRAMADAVELRLLG